MHLQVDILTKDTIFKESANVTEIMAMWNLKSEED